MVLVREYSVWFVSYRKQVECFVNSAMSRCFPFPPPGYEKKSCTNDVDLLKKEKHREKKHKKEKRDKEKKESKDKGKKERSEGNDREKKDKKEKRGDQAKDKEKNGVKDKYKSSVTVEDGKKLAWKPVVHTGEILGQNGFTNVGKAPGKVFGNSEDKLSPNNHRLVKDTQHSKSVQDLGRRIGDGDRGPVQNHTGTDRKKEEKTVVRLVTKDFGNGPEAKDKNRDRIDGPGSKVMPESNGNTVLTKFLGFDQGKFEGKTDPIEKSIGRKAEGKTKTTKKERDDKHGGKDREKKSKGKDKKSEKEKKKEVKCDEKTTEQDKIKGGENGYMGIYSDNMPVVKDGDIASEIQGHLRKRKDFGENGVFLGSGQVPDVPDGGVNPHLHPDANINLSKRPYPPSILSSHSLVQNGKVLDAWQSPLSSGAILGNLVVDEKKLEVIGMIEGQPVPSSSSKPVPTTSKPKKITPHPDGKYLDEVLSVPKMEEWSEFDDQEWLLCGDETSLKKPRIDNFCVNDLPRVWDKAVLIGSADVYALPYVIPY